MDFYMVFNSRERCMRAERLLQSRGIAAAVTPTPAGAGSACQLSLRLDAGQKSDAYTAVMRSGLQAGVKGCFVQDGLRLFRTACQ